MAKPERKGKVKAYTAADVAAALERIRMADIEHARAQCLKVGNHGIRFDHNHLNGYGHAGEATSWQRRKR